MNNQKSNREDDFKNRLLLKFKNAFNISPDELKIINENVYLVFTENKYLVIKRYKSKNHIMKQIWLARLFADKSFPGSVRFTPFASGKYIKRIDKYYYAMMPYIEGKALTYNSRKDRIAAYDQLRNFQQEVSILTDRRPEFVPKYSLYSKWATRLDTFFYNLNNNRMLLTDSQLKMMKRFLKWGEYSLDTLPIDVLEQKERSARRKGIIIHGDVANHNFIRKPDGSIVMIDYDLMACAPSEYDTLQLVNRFFPYCDYSLKDIMEEFHHSLSDLINTKWFATALIYPTDIYREWNRLITNEPINEKKIYDFVYQLERHYVRRMELVSDLRDIVRKNIN
jgi:thiamine kinase-like enzyme